MWTAHWLLAVFLTIPLLVHGGPAPPPYTIKWEIEEPVESIQGSYDVVSMDIADNPPMLASIWEFNTEFSVVAWPPKYCHAIHICFIPTSKRNLGHFHVEKTLCTHQFVKWYPHISKVVVKADENIAEVKMFNQMNSIRFKAAAGTATYTIDLADKAYDQNEHFGERPAPGTPLTIDLNNKMALILTNSRFCFAHVAQAGNVNKYYALFSPEKYKTPDDLPQVFTSYNKPMGKKSIFKPLLTIPSTKSVDLLHHLKGFSLIPQERMRQTPTCSSFRTKSTNSLKKSIGVVSADSWTAAIANTNANERNEMFYIYIGKQCSWLRVWISANSAHKMSDYMKTPGPPLGDMIDFFFDQQFMVPADSDEARPLFGNSSQIGIIGIRRFPVAGASRGFSSENIVEVAYGRDRGPGLPFIEYFHMPSFHGFAPGSSSQSAGTAFKVTLIKAANCEAVLIPGSQHIRLSSATTAQTNTMNFSDCEHTLYNATIPTTKNN